MEGSSGATARATELRKATAAIRAAEMLAGEAAATVWAAHGCRVHRGRLSLETEHRRIGANLWEATHAEMEAGRGELRLWRCTDAADTAITTLPAASTTFHTLRLDGGATVSLTQSPRKEEPHTFRVTLPAEAGETRQKHVLAAASGDALADWIAILTAEICLCSLRPDVRHGLIAMHSYLLQQAAPPERVTDGEVALLPRSLAAWLPRSAWSADVTRCRSAVGLSRVRLMLVLGPPDSTVTPMALAAAAAAAWPSTDCLSLIAAHLLPACRAGSRPDPPSLPDDDAHGAVELVRHLVDTYRTSTRALEAAGGESSTAAGAPVVAPVLWPPHDGACLRYCTFGHPMQPDQIFELRFKQSGCGRLWGAPLQFGVANYVIESRSTPLDYARTAYFLAGDSQQGTTGVARVGSAVSWNGEKALCSDHDSVLHAVHSSSRLQLRLLRVVSGEDDVGSSTLDPSGGLRLLQCRVNEEPWFPAADSARATPLRDGVAYYPSLCLWARQDGHTLPELVLDVDTAAAAGRGYDAASSASAPSVSADDAEEGAMCDCNRSADWHCSEGVDGLGRGSKCRIVFEDGRARPVGT